MAIINITATGLADDNTALNDLTYKIYNGATDAFIVAKGSHTSDADVTVTGTTVVINNVNIGALGAGDTVKVTAVDDDGTPLEGNLSATFTVTSGDVTAPTLVSATIEDAAPTNMVMVFSEIVTGTNLGFTVAGTTSAVFASISGSGTTTITGVLATAAANGETITLAYDSAVGDIVDAASNDLATFGATAVTNNIAAAGGYVDIVEANSTMNANFTFVAGTPNYFNATANLAHGVVDATYAGAFDFSIAIIDVYSKSVGFGLANDATLAYPSSMIYIDESYKLFLEETGSTAADNVSAMTATAGNYLRFERASAAADVLVYYYDGTSETLMHNFGNLSTLTYVKFFAKIANRRVQDPKIQ